jgi:hypothetical protein
MKRENIVGQYSSLGRRAFLKPLWDHHGIQLTHPEIIGYEKAIRDGHALIKVRGNDGINSYYLTMNGQRVTVTANAVTGEIIGAHIPDTRRSHATGSKVYVNSRPPQDSLHKRLRLERG